MRKRRLVGHTLADITRSAGRLTRRLPPHAAWGGLTSRAAALFGLAGLAITQPVLDLFGRNPTFFVAGRYGAGQIVAFGLVVALVPAALVVAVVGLATLAHHRAGAVAYVGGLGGLGLLFGLSVARRVGLEALAPAAVAGTVTAVGVLLLDRRFRAARQLLAYLVVGNVAFAALFLVASPASDLVTGGTSEAAAAAGAPRLSGPVVVLVLDEFPLTSLLRPDGSIDDSRFPRFDELARNATWFRNASTESTETHVSVPSILSGRQGGSGDLPTVTYYPRNLLTLFGDRYPVHEYQTLTDLCSPGMCATRRDGRLGQALEDAVIAYGHQVLPDPLPDRLPAVDQSWGGFTADRAGDSGQTFDEFVRANLDDWARNDEGPVAGLRSVVASMGPEPSVNLAHVLLPHNPWALTPNVAPTTRGVFPRDVPDDPGDPTYEFAYRQLYQAHLMQVGAVDTLVGEMIDHLRSVGAWDQALVVVVADHGVDTAPPGVGRDVTPETQDEVLRIPLFVKAPGQRGGDVRDDPATTLDVLPSIIDLLDVDLDVDLDGHSLFDGSEPPATRRLTSEFAGALGVAERHAAEFPHGGGWLGLAAVGENGDLVGRHVDEVEIGAPSALSWSLDQREVFDRVSTTSGPVPLMVAGMVRGSSGPPPELLVAANGTLAGTLGGYSSTDGGWRFSGMLAPVLVDGANEIAAYEVERTGSQVVLHPLG